MHNILITGGSAGIGKSLVDILSSDLEWKIITCSRSIDENTFLDSTLEYIDAIKTDLGDVVSRTAFIDTVLKRYTSLDVLVLNAAVTGVAEIDECAYTETYVRGVNIEANKEIIERFLPLLRKNHGTIIFISSSIFMEPDRDEIIDLYANTKKDFEQRMYDYALKAENTNVKFIVFRPGMTSTRLHTRILKIGHGKLYERTNKMIGENKLHDSFEVAKAIKNLVAYSGTDNTNFSIISFD